MKSNDFGMFHDEAWEARMGIDPFEPDWSSAPGWAEYSTVDAYGTVAWHEKEPQAPGRWWRCWTNTGGRYAHQTVRPELGERNWRNSLRRRPKEFR